MAPWEERRVLSGSRVWTGGETGGDGEGRAEDASWSSSQTSGFTMAKGTKRVLSQKWAVEFPRNSIPGEGRPTHRAGRMLFPNALVCDK